MKFIFVILFFISGQLLYSQTIIKIIPPRNISDDYQLVNLSDTAFIETGHSDDMGHPYGHYYKIKPNVPDGEYLIYFYDVPVLRAFIKNSQKDSVWTTYNSIGTPRSVTPYKKGLINGDMIMYYNTGDVYTISNYVNNQISGKSITFYESGKIKYITVYENGEYIKQDLYNENGELIYVDKPTENHHKDSLKLNTKKMDDIKFAEFTSIRIAYKEYGSGEPLIMCIGYGANMDLWSTDVIDMLKEKFRVIVFDYRGMGYSTNKDTSFTINTLAEDLNELMNALEIKKANVLGWSMGGFVAQMFAIKHSDKVNKLVLYATNCGGTKTVNPSEEIIKILSNPAASPLELISTLFPDQWLKENPEPWKFLPDAKEPYNGKTIGQQYAAVQDWLSPGGGSAEQLNNLNMQVLLICGNQDKVVPYENSSILSELIKSSRLTVIEDCGHGLMYQLPETFAENVLSFLCE